MAIPFKHCQSYRTSNLSEITSVLQENSLGNDNKLCVLIGSRAIRQFLQNFRGTEHVENANNDIIIFSECLLQWLHSTKTRITMIDMIAPQSYNGEQLDLYICCVLNNGPKYDFSVPRSATSYTALILNNSQQWTIDSNCRHFKGSLDLIKNASVELLLILKRCMLYYSHQWLKTATDYYELLTISTPLTANHMELCHLFINYNEKLHGKRPNDSPEFSIDSAQCNATLLGYLRQLEPVDSTDQRTIITINREKFVHYTKDQQISLIYQLAKSLSNCNDILIGLEHICTQSPLWLADCAIENWIDIFQEKFKHISPSLSAVTIQVNLPNYRLFPDIPEIATTEILHCITTTADIYSMQLVCKQWYGVLDEEVFWRDLYTSRFGACADQSEQVYSWKMLYLIRLEGKSPLDDLQLNQLAEATTTLRQYTAIDVVKLWEYFTHRDQPVETNLLARIDYVISNSFYCEIRELPTQYFVRLILIGLEHTSSRSEVSLNLRMGKYGHVRYRYYKEQLRVQYESNMHQHSFYLSATPYSTYRSTDQQDTPNGQMCFGRDASVIYKQYPEGLLNCLFIMMAHPDQRAQHINYIKKST